MSAEEQARIHSGRIAVHTALGGRSVDIDREILQEWERREISFLAGHAAGFADAVKMLREIKDGSNANAEFFANWLETHKPPAGRKE